MKIQMQIKGKQLTQTNEKGESLQYILHNQGGGRRRSNGRPRNLELDHFWRWLHLQLWQQHRVGSGAGGHGGHDGGYGGGHDGGHHGGQRDGDHRVKGAW